jgi:hypothetical protein
MNFSRANWMDKMDDFKEGFDLFQIKQIQQLIYPTALDLNASRYVSNITYDCLKAIWNRIVSVPFLYPNGEIRYFLNSTQTI